MTNTTQRPVIVTTAHRGVFCGLVDHQTNATADHIKINQAKMAMRWGTNKGLFELAETGPTPKSQISAPADVDLVDITAVIDVTDTAWKAWQNA